MLTRLISADFPRSRVLAVYKDTARFFYSLDGKDWIEIGGPMQMTYTLPHFMGYRFGLFDFATKTAGGSAEFDYFRVGSRSGHEGRSLLRKIQ